MDAPGSAADIARLLASRHPAELTDEQRKQAWRGRVLVDHFRNRFGQTVVVPSSLRARPGAPVSTPIDSGELGRTGPQRFTVRSVLRRLAPRDDP